MLRLCFELCHGPGVSQGHLFHVLPAHPRPQVSRRVDQRVQQEMRPNRRLFPPRLPHWYHVVRLVVVVVVVGDDFTATPFWRPLEHASLDIVAGFRHMLARSLRSWSHRPASLFNTVAMNTFVRHDPSIQIVVGFWDPNEPPIDQRKESSKQN